MTVKYFHPTKTGGSSIEKALGIKKTHHIINNRDLKYADSFLKIATVRNPYDRALSSYNFFKELQDKSFKEFLGIVEELRDRSLQYYPQHWYTHVEGVQFVDHIIRLENFEEDLKKLPIDLKVLHENKTKNKRKASLTKKEKNAIYKLYKKDFELLGYER